MFVQVPLGPDFRQDDRPDSSLVSLEISYIGILFLE